MGLPVSSTRMAWWTCVLKASPTARSALKTSRWISKRGNKSQHQTISSKICSNEGKQNGNMKQVTSFKEAMVPWYDSHSARSRLVPSVRGGDLCTSALAESARRARTFRPSLRPWQWADRGEQPRATKESKESEAQVAQGLIGGFNIFQPFPLKKKKTKSMGRPSQQGMEVVQR